MAFKVHKARRWREKTAVAAGGVALLLLAGCQGPVRPPPTRPPAPITVSVPRPRQPLNPIAWRTEAGRWLGVKYRLGGVDQTGIDCSGLACQLYRNVAGVNLPRTTADQARGGTPVSRKDLRAGDLIFFVSLSEKTINHVGIYLGEERFVHASPSKGVVVSSLLLDYYVKHYHSARRIIP